MNYIHHLSSFYRQLDEDPRIKPLHIALYMALFQTWNYNYFSSSFIMGRTRLMQMSRIASKTSFAKMLRELNEFGYIIYEPSGRTARKPMIRMLAFHEMNYPGPQNGTAPVHEMNKPGPENGTDPVPKPGHIDKQLKTKINNAISVCEAHTSHLTLKKRFIPPEKEEVLRWFAEKNIPLEKASIFFHHYNAIGWKIGRHIMRDWQEAAEKWIFTTKEKTDYGSSSYLHTDNRKDFGEPL